MIESSVFVFLTPFKSYSLSCNLLPDTIALTKCFCFPDEVVLLLVHYASWHRLTV